MDFSSLSPCRYCVIGDPVDHSQSPAMQNAAFAAYQMGEFYGKCRVRLAEIDDFFAFARDHLQGVNITVPLKEAAAQKVDKIGNFAAATNSVNTLNISGGRISGESTDGEGVLRALEETLHFAPEGKNILFLGAGGAARAASFALAFKGAKSIVLLNRTVERAKILTKQLQNHFPQLESAAASYGDTAEVKRFFAGADLVIQSTALGWHDDDPPILEIPETGAAFFDFVYRDTHFLHTARQRGLAAADGKTMLLHQGAASFEIWTGKTAPLDAMRRALGLI